MNTPLISVIIPCHNSLPDELCIAIDSMLNQTYKNLEIIIVDDHSTTDIKAIIKPYTDKYANIFYSRVTDDDPDRLAPNGTNINAGWQARNHGLRIAKGEMITFQDDDDSSCSNRIEFQYAMMEKYKAMHVSVDWQQYRDEYKYKKLEYQITDKDIVTTAEILDFAKKTKPKLFKNPFPRGGSKNIFEKILRRVDTKFLTSQYPYPAANSPLFKKEILEKCHFRQAYERTRPSLKGRGADRDFNYWVAETFKSSIAIKIPLYLWRTNYQNFNYLDKKYQPK